MFGIDQYAAFISAILLFQLVPGPGTFTILHATARGGIGAGIGAVVGTLAGDLVYMLAAVTGLAALLTASPLFFTAMQWAGLAYLCRFGWRLLRVDPAGNAPDDTIVNPDCCQAMRRAFVVGLTNPKVIFFFVSFFPLFMSSKSGATTLGVMMVHVTLICFLYQVLLVLVGDRVGRLLSGMEKVSLLARRFAGVVLIAFGIKLAFDSN